MKYTALTDPLHQYVCRHRTGAADNALQRLRRETLALGDEARMQISEEQGSFLTILTAAIGAARAIEVGTFTGYSSICIARGLPEDGHLICLDASEEWTAMARRYWKETGVDHKIDLCIGPALGHLRRLDSGTVFDLAFIDADKSEYDDYFELLLPHVRSNGLLILDNMLWGGRVIDDAMASDPDTRSINAMNAKLAADPRVECVLLPVADGLQICRKR